MEAGLAGAEGMAASSEKILAAYAKAPDCGAVRETVRRETANLVSALKDIHRILGKLRCSELEELGRLREENGDLKSKNRKLLIELRDALGVNSALKEKDAGEAAPEKARPGKPAENVRRPRGAPRGHRGNTRAIPDRWDEKMEIPPPSFCECGCGQILESGESDRKYIEDIPPVSRKVTLLEYRRGICARCGKELRHEEAAGPAVEIGGNLAAHLAMLRQTGLSYRKIASLCSETLAIPLSPSGAMGVVNRVVGKKMPVYETIGNVLSRQEVLNGDETGWKVRQEQWYVWILCNTAFVYLLPDKSRSARVPEKLLGKDFGGTMVCDFYGAYNFLQNTQRCLVHFTRDIEKEREALPGSVTLERFEDRVWNFIDAGVEISRMPGGDEKDNAAKMLGKELSSIARMDLPKGRPQTLQKRIVKYHDEMMKFVDTPGVEWHNNRAERHLRPLVVSRKMSFGSDTPEGAGKTCVLHSVVETCRLQKIRPVDLLRENMMKGHPDNSPLTQLLTSRLNI
jgi:transposase